MPGSASTSCGGGRRVDCAEPMRMVKNMARHIVDICIIEALMYNLMNFFNSKQDPNKWSAGRLPLLDRKNYWNCSRTCFKGNLEVFGSIVIQFATTVVVPG